MGHCRLKIIFISLFITTCFRYSNACRIQGTMLGIPVSAWVRDVDRGTLWRNDTTGIVGINNYLIGGVTDNKGYLGVHVVDSQFELFMTEYFNHYEEKEVSQTMTVSVTYTCTANTNNVLPQIISMNVVDTNNNPPTFLRANEYVFNIAAPMPPGYEITGCSNLITVRDIDLTTQKIIFKIEDNPYFEIEEEIYRNPSTPKEFKAILRTKTFIRTFPEQLKLTIWATDHDETGDPPRTNAATITFHGNTDFVLPEEPVFSATFYIAYYTNDNRVVLTEPISLKSGYDKFVQFYIAGGNSNFELIQDQENKLSIRVVEPLAEEDLKGTNMHLIVTAERPFTSGASATVVLRLPEARLLKFEASTHRGSLQNKVLKLDPIRLTVGYDNTVVFSISGDYAKYFRITNGQNPAVISLKPCFPSAVILNNNIILLTVTASGLNFVTTTTNVILDLIKDDRTVPKFNSNIYYGKYWDTSNFKLPKIHLTQGFGSDVTFKLDGENAQYFGLSNKGNDVVVYPRSVIPQDVIFEKKVLVFNILAMKALTVGASAAISISFPPYLTNPVIMRFTQTIYTGTLANNGLTIDDSIKLSVGYAPGTQFILTGEYGQHFRAEPKDDGLTLTLLDALPNEARGRAFLLLEIEARRENVVSALTGVVIEVVRQETVAPVFDQAYYRGAYNTESGLRFTQVISLSQGYDDTVSFTLEGEFVSFFDLIMTGDNSLIVSVSQPIPNDVLQAHSQFLFAVVATKPGALVARSAVSIGIEKDLLDRVILRFTQNVYTGTLESSVLAMDDSIKLSAGYAPGTEFILTGDLSEYFSLEQIDDGLTLKLLASLPVETIERAFIVLEIEARRENTVSAWTSVVIEVVREEIIAVPPVIKLN